MKEVSYFEFLTKIAKDFNLSLDKEFNLKLPNDKRKIKNFVRSKAYKIRIFDGKQEFPYMINNLINNIELKNGIELRYLGIKSIKDLENECDIQIKRANCRICEGGGWSSSGIRYVYKDIYCEI